MARTVHELTMVLGVLREATNSVVRDPEGEWLKGRPRSRGAALNRSPRDGVLQSGWNFPSWGRLTVLLTASRFFPHDVFLASQRRRSRPASVAPEGSLPSLFFHELVSRTFQPSSVATLQLWPAYTSPKRTWLPPLSYPPTSFLVTFCSSSPALSGTLYLPVIGWETPERPGERPTSHKLSPELSLSRNRLLLSTCSQLRRNKVPVESSKCKLCIKCYRNVRSWPQVSYWLWMSEFLSKTWLFCSCLDPVDTYISYWHCEYCLDIRINAIDLLE